MTLCRTLIRTFAEGLVEQPDRLLQITNQRILQDMSGGMFVTLFYGVLDPASGELVYSNAGQTPPFLLDDHSITALDRTGMALGISEEVSWEKRTLRVAPGGALVLYTDGIMEAQNLSGAHFGRDYLGSLLQQHLNRPAQHILDMLLSEIYQFTGPASRLDDITLMVLVRER